jgi:hypothetical protein
VGPNSLSVINEPNSLLYIDNRFSSKKEKKKKKKNKKKDNRLVMIDIGD